MQLDKLKKQQNEGSGLSSSQSKDIQDNEANPMHTKEIEMQTSSQLPAKRTSGKLSSSVDYFDETIKSEDDQPCSDYFNFEDDQDSEQFAFYGNETKCRNENV